MKDLNLILYLGFAEWGVTVPRLNLFKPDGAWENSSVNIKQD